ncbi:uncharacterized protein LOC123670730 [Harmonia axyridis]|uniref:uncharacterized protein LOC123670730 n=1 Tax=Harmonia axyridis TaxID=115357 RepID=UPI001E279142|nr:uncharacterized protein LOC123670730 [Harmonia axyridis]
MSSEQFLMVCVVAFVISYSDQKIKLPCSASSDLDPGIFWPDIDHGTCSTSIPGCTDEKGHLGIRCCNDGKPSEPNCKKNASIRDPRCFGNMRSTIVNSNMDICYEVVYNTKFQFECVSNTGLMIPPNYDMYTKIAGNETGIWLPIEKFDSYRYITVNNSYMDPVESTISRNYPGACAILIGGLIKFVSCNERYVGICLNFPFVIYKVLPMNELSDVLLLKDFCTSNYTKNSFCSYFNQRYHMNLVYFSSRSYVQEPYIILQKSNLRLILQIRMHDPPEEDGTVYLHVGLAKSDWNIFINKSYHMSYYDATDENLYKAPKIILSINENTISVKKYDANNIKWTQKYEFTHYIFCFSCTAPEYSMTKLEVLDSYTIDMKSKNGSFWCEAFDYDLNIISSNVISFGNQVFYYISEMIISIYRIQSCDIQNLRDKIIRSIIVSKDIELFHFDIKNFSIIYCDSSMAEVDVSVYWRPERKTTEVKEIEEEHQRLSKILQETSEKNHWNISYIQLRHSDYCFKETRKIGDFLFSWPTTPSLTYALSYPHCYKYDKEITKVVQRKCFKSCLGCFWSTVIEYCEPNSNLTQLLQEIYSSGNFVINGVLNNLNLAVRNNHQDFIADDVDLLSKIIKNINEAPSNIVLDLKNLSLLINNLQLIKTDVLKISQDKYQTTDSITNTSDNIYLSTKESPNFIEANHCYYTINLTEHPNATGIILRTSGNTYKTIILESVLPMTVLDKDDDHEAAIYFLEEYLKLYKEKKDAVLKLSMFFNNYLFDVDHSTLTTKIIFKVLLSDDMKSYPFTSFLTMKNEKGGKVCACWKYSSLEHNDTESKWQKSAKFVTYSHSTCIYNSTSYCTIFSTESEQTDGYVSVILVRYSNSIEDRPYYFSLIIEEIYKLFVLMILNRDEILSYEIGSIRNITQRIIEIVVIWIPETPAHTIPMIEEEYADLKYYVGKLSTNYPNNKVINWMEVLSFRHRKYCLEDTYLYDEDTKFTFRTTALHDVATSSPICYNLEGVLRRRCIGSFDSGSLWEDLDNLSFKHCFSYVTESLNFILKSFIDMNANEVLKYLEQMTEKSKVDFKPLDVNLLSEILFLISYSTETQNLDIKSVSALISNIQEIDKDVLRNSQLQFNATDKILDSLDEILLKSNITINKNARFCTVPLNDLQSSEALILQSDGNDYKISVVQGAVNNNFFLNNYENFEGAVFFHNFSGNYSIIVSIFFGDILFVDSTCEHPVSLVFSILIPSHNGTFNRPSKNIEIVFKNHNGKDRACAYWKYGIDNAINISGRWENESEPHDNDGFFTCKFNHTTHFAMLINDDSSDPEYLIIVTNIGCSLSLIGLIGIFITGLLFQRWRQNSGNIILMNFVITVAIQICLFYFSGVIHGVMSESNSCILIGALLHYSVISEFCWMLIIAILQFKRFVQVLTRPPSYILLKSFLGGWGFPLIPVLCVLLIDPENYMYSMTGICYPSKIGLYLAVWLPIMVITITNSIIFSYIIYSVCNRRTECVDTISNEIIFQWRLAILLFFMLGLTWSFAILSEFILRDLFAYLFCITATLQGFIMFLFFIVLNDRTRLLYSVLFRTILK